MPTPEQSHPDHQDPHALRPLSRRTLLKGLAGIGGLTVAHRLLGPGAAFAADTGSAAYLPQTALATDIANPVPLPPPVEAAGRVLHGVWLPNGPGSSTEATTGPTAYSTYVGTGLGGGGHAPAILNFFRAWSLDKANYTTNPATMFQPVAARLDAITAKGAVPMLTWEPWDPSGGVQQADYSLTALTSGAAGGTGGTMDGMIRAFANGCANWGKPVILRLAHEMNAPTYPWGPQGVGPKDGTDYKPFWIHVHDIFTAAGASNVIWAWVPNIDYSKTIQIDTGVQYPGHDYVDWVGLDGYNGYHSYTYDPTTGVDTWSDYPALLDASLDKLVTVTQSTKPIMIAETGCPDLAVQYDYKLSNGTTWRPPVELSTSTTQAARSKIQWFKDFYAYAADDSRDASTPALKRSLAQRNVRAVCYFNETGTKPSNWALTPTNADTLNQSQTGYQAALGLSAVGHGWGDTAADTAGRASGLSQSFVSTNGTPVNSLADWMGSSPDAKIVQASSTDYYASMPCAAGKVSVVTTTNSAKYRLNGDEIYFQVRNVPTTGTSRFRLIVDSSNELNFTCTPTSTGVQLTFNYRLNSSTDTRVANSTALLITDSAGVLKGNFAWWRIREVAGFIFWETCADARAANPGWVRQAAVYNLFRKKAFTPQFSTGAPAGSATATPTPAFNVTNYNKYRYTARTATS